MVRFLPLHLQNFGDWLKCEAEAVTEVIKLPETFWFA